MNYRRVASSLFFIFLALALGACAGSKGKDDDAQAQGKRLPAYFEEIPADTFYFVGGSEPMPAALIANGLEKFETFRKWGEELDADVPVAGQSLEEANRAAAEANKPPEPPEFLLEKMGGEVSAEGLEKLGISSSPRVASYMVGVVPVLRFTLSDEKKFLALVDDLEKTYDEPGTELEHQKVSYRRYGAGGDYLLLRTTSDEAVMAVVDDDVFEIFLPYFVGAKMPKKSLADDNAFLRTVENNGFKRFGAGYFDFEKMIAYGTGTEQPQGITKAILDKSNFYMDKSEQCKTEFMRIARMMPKLVAGFRAYDKTTTDFAFGAELEDGFARELAKTVSGTPGHNTAFAQKSLIEVGLGLDMGKLLDFVVAEAQKVQMQPFQCEQFQDANRTANNIIGGAGQVPPAMRKLAGFNVLLRNVVLEWKADNTKNGTTVWIPRVLGALRTDQPQAFMFLVGQFFPQAKQLQAQPDGNPVPIPQAAGVYEGIIDPLLVMTQRGLAVTVGPKMVDNGKEVLAAEPSATSPALVLRLNLGDSAQELVSNIKSLVDKAEADKDARGLTADDITKAREAIATIEAYLPKGAWSATFTTEFSDFGVLFAYRDQGELDIDWDRDPSPEVQENFEALGKVLGEDPPAAATIEEKAVEPAPKDSTIQIRRKGDGMGTRGEF